MSILIKVRVPQNLSEKVKSKGNERKRSVCSNRLSIFKINKIQLRWWNELYEMCDAVDSVAIVFVRLFPYKLQQNGHTLKVY